MLLLVLALGGGFFFFNNLTVVWPLANIEYYPDTTELRLEAEGFLNQHGYSTKDYHFSSIFVKDEEALNYAARTSGSDKVIDWTEKGVHFMSHRLMFKKPGEATEYALFWSSPTGIFGFRRILEDDNPGNTISEQVVRDSILPLLRTSSGLNFLSTPWSETLYRNKIQSQRTDHEFQFERVLDSLSGLREVLSLSIQGSETGLFLRNLKVPPVGLRRERSLDGWREFLFGLSLLGIAFGGVMSLILVIKGFQGVHPLRIGQSLRAVLLIGLGLILATSVQNSMHFYKWDPLWPYSLSVFKNLLYPILTLIPTMFLLFLFITAGAQCDDKAKAGRGESLWHLLKGNLFHKTVALASVRGYLIGLVCGLVLALTVIGFRELFNGTIPVQPQGFFSYAFNSSFPSVSLLFFFFNIAMMEELGYRYFGGSWLYQKLNNKHLAVWIPAVIYGLFHTSLGFLPPAEPWWGRAVALTLVGAVWGYAFFKYDALTVVLSHFSADLFIFNWPRLYSRDSSEFLFALVCILVPLVPALGWFIYQRTRFTKG
jgi:hypothetical protein